MKDRYDPSNMELLRNAARAIHTQADGAKPMTDTNETELKPQDYDTDEAVAMVYDTLCDRGHDPLEIAALLDGYDGDLWVEVFGPAVDRAAECIGVPAYPGEDDDEDSEDEDDEADWMKSACEDEDYANNQ